MFKLRFKPTVFADRKKAKRTRAESKRRKQEALESNNPRMVSIIPHGLRNGKNQGHGKMPRGDRGGAHKSRTEVHEERMKYDENYRRRQTALRMVREQGVPKQDKIAPPTERTMSQQLDQSQLALLKLQMELERLGADIRGLQVVMGQ